MKDCFARGGVIGATTQGSMETIFDDDFGEVGGEVEGHCSKCRTDTTHTILTRYEEEVRSVQCNICGSVHLYRPPRGDAEDEIPEPVAIKRRQAAKKMTWDEAMKSLDKQSMRPYDVRASYREGMLVEHTKFGRGFVSEVLSDTKMEATFKDGRRVLVYNRRDLPGAPKVRGKIPTPPPPLAQAPVPRSRVAAAAAREAAASKREAALEAARDVVRAAALGEGVSVVAKPAASTQPTGRAPSAKTVASPPKTAAKASAAAAKAATRVPKGRKKAPKKAPTKKAARAAVAKKRPAKQAARRPATGRKRRR